jgi:hypothetical protein
LLLKRRWITMPLLLRYLTPRRETRLTRCELALAGYVRCANTVIAP